ncbi:shikimate kinase [Staphylococcus schleiferi]|uniref:shikimate kinase n=1 Tax=Staphylococcus schleiferi TaxID=1295 RepID=UPI00248174C2|nr:shikimate kinase [Staphylococcus schleiferi]
MKTTSKMPIVLIGFMGAGKSTIGKILSRELNCSFTDLDSLVEAQLNQSIPEIFELEGEKAFRRYECQYLKHALEKNDIIATGGGILSDDQTFNFLKKQEITVVWIDAPFEILYERIKNDANRPNANKKSYDALKSLYYSRNSRYNEIAFIKISSKISLRETLNEIKNTIFANDQY